MTRSSTLPNQFLQLPSRPVATKRFTWFPLINFKVFTLRFESIFAAQLL